MTGRVYQHEKYEKRKCNHKGKSDRRIVFSRTSELLKQKHPKHKSTSDVFNPVERDVIPLFNLAERNASPLYDTTRKTTPF